MKIQGYEIGSEVQWTDRATGGFRTGIVRARYYDPDSTIINGEEIEINVIGQSPAYKVEDQGQDDIFIIDHSKVVLHQSNQ